MIAFTAHTFECVCHCRRAMFRVLGMYNFGYDIKIFIIFFKNNCPGQWFMIYIIVPEQLNTLF